MTFKVKHNGTWKDPEGIYVKQNGSWVEIDELFIKQNGAWQSRYTSTIPPLVLVDYATKSSLLGGFTYDDCWNPPGTSGVGTTGSYFYSDGNGLSINAPYWGCGTASSNNNVNLAGVVSMTITYSYSNVAYYGNSSVSWPKSDGTRGSFEIRGLSNNASLGVTTTTVAVTLPGNGKIEFGGGNTNGGLFYVHKLQFNYA